MSRDWVHLARRPLFGLSYQPRMMMDDDDCGAIGGMIGRGNQSTRRNPVPVPLCPPQIPHDLTWAWTLCRHDGKPATIRLSCVQLHALGASLLGKGPPDIYWIGGWLSLLPSRNRSPTVQPMSHRLTGWALRAPRISVCDCIFVVPVHAHSIFRIEDSRKSPRADCSSTLQAEAVHSTPKWWWNDDRLWNRFRFPLH
jgi:hypothetical protein